MGASISSSLGEMSEGDKETLLDVCANLDKVLEEVEGVIVAMATPRGLPTAHVTCAFGNCSFEDLRTALKQRYGVAGDDTDHWHLVRVFYTAMSRWMFTVGPLIKSYISHWARWANRHEPKDGKEAFMMERDASLAFVGTLKRQWKEIDALTQQLLKAAWPPCAAMLAMTCGFWGDATACDFVLRFRQFEACESVDQRLEIVCRMEQALADVMPGWIESRHKDTFDVNGYFVMNGAGHTPTQWVRVLVVLAAITPAVSLGRALSYLTLASVVMMGRGAASFSNIRHHIDSLLERVAAASVQELHQAIEDVNATKFGHSVSLLETLWVITHLQTSSNVSVFASNPHGLHKPVVCRAAARLVSAIPIDHWHTVPTVATYLPPILQYICYARTPELLCQWTTVEELLQLVETASQQYHMPHSGYEKSRMSSIRDAANHNKMLEVFLLSHRLMCITSPSLCGDVVSVIISYCHHWGRIAAPRWFFKKLRLPHSGQPVQ